MTDKMKQEIRDYLEREGINQIELSRMMGKGRTYISDTVRPANKYGLQKHRAEFIDQFVGFSAEAWEDAHRYWADRLGDGPQPWPVTVRNLIANPPPYNWKSV